MPSVTVARSGLTASELKDALSKQLEPRYTMLEKSPERLKVSTSAASSATVHLVSRPDGTHCGVHGGGFIIGRIINELLIARTVAKAIRSAPELQALA